MVSLSNGPKCQLFKFHLLGTSLAVQWLRLHASTAGGTGSIPSWGTKIPPASWCGQNNNNNNNKYIKFHLPDIYLIQVLTIHIFPLNQLSSLNNLKITFYITLINHGFGVLIICFLEY